MRISFSFWSALVAIVFVLTAIVPFHAHAQQSLTDFEETECMLEVTFTPSESVMCGYLTVPEYHKQNNGRTIRLAVAIIKSNSANPEPDPIVMLQGGPGGSTLDSYMNVFGAGQLSGLLKKRDVILFDQRGTLHSEPALMCSELWDLTTETIERRLSREEAKRLSLAAVAECRKRLLAEDIELSAFNSVENAADVNALRQALGYEKINLYGVSYGTLLALHTMRDHPDALRSVILDAVVPTQTNFVPQVAQSQQRAFHELFAACAADADCNTYYPNLEKVFFDLVARLNQEPARVPMTDPDTKQSYQAVIDGDTLESLLFQLLYVTEIIPALPHVIYQMRDGDYSFLSRIAPLLIFDKTMAYGMYDSVICAEDADFSLEEVDINGVRPELAEYAKDDAQSILDTCKIWNVPELDLALDAPISSDIPTLIMNGRFDPITPPANGELAAETLSNSTVVTFGFTGHSAATSGDCAEALMVAFLDNPQRKLDTACVAEKQEPTFISPTTLHFTKLIERILSAMEQQQYAPFILAVVCLLPLLSLFLVAPIVWLIRKLSPPGNATQSGMVPVVTRLTAVVAVVAGLAFIIGLIVVIAQSAGQGQETMLLFGVPKHMAWLSAMPWVMLVAAISTLVGTVVLWMRHLQPTWERVYLSSMACAALCSAAGMLWIAM